MSNYSVETACSERTPGHCVTGFHSLFSVFIFFSLRSTWQQKYPTSLLCILPLPLVTMELVFPSRLLSASPSPSPNFFSNFYSKKNLYRRDTGKESLGKRLWANSWSETGVYQMNKQEKGISGREKNILNLFKAPHPSIDHLFLSHGPPDLPK